MVMEGFGFAGGTLLRHAIATYEGNLPAFAEGAALIADLHKRVAPLQSLPLNQLVAPGMPGLVFAP